jgi:tetratricopeptide (TPR) repeat protein
MSDASKAVFLSYASQDAAAVERIAEALRAAGVEVWFDRNELVGGDAWDAKIRKQIAECALFVPIISAATQARLEGYFRVEWRLAAQRTHAMAEEKAFLLPVVIDGTRDAEAHVPAEFKAVQWTRLRQDYGGQARIGSADSLGAFAARVGSLVVGALVVGGAGVGSGDGAAGPTTASLVRQERISRRRRPIRVIMVAAFVVVAVLVAWRPWRMREANPPASISPRAPTTQIDAPTSQLREWVAKARALYEPWDLATLEDFKQAEVLLLRALQLDPSDVEALASQALLSCGMYVIPHDQSPERMREARARAEMAVKLAPNSDYALFAFAYALRLPPETEQDGIRLLRQLVERNPQNKMMLRVLGAPLSRRAATMEEGLELLARAAALPGGEPMSEYVRGETLARRTTRYPEAIAAFDRAIALAPQYPDAHKEKIKTLLDRMGDVEAARAALERVPATLLRDDRVILVAYKVAMASDDPNRALRVLADASPYMTTDLFRGPSGYLKGLAHRRASRVAAAEVEWRSALAVTQGRLVRKPADPDELLWKTVLHGLLGDRANMAAAHELHRQFSATQSTNSQRYALNELVRGMQSSPEDAIARIKARLTDHSNQVRQVTSAAVLFDPALDPWRSQPGFAALVVSAKAEFAAQHGTRETK